MNRIKEVLNERGIKQTWLADKLGKSYNMVNSYCQNRRQPSLEVLNDIARVLETDLCDLIICDKLSANSITNKKPILARTARGRKNKW